MAKKIIVAVLGLPVRVDGKFLMTRRNQPGMKVWHNKWQVAGGGLEFGEEPEQTLARELQEEIGVSARILHPLPIVKTSIWYGHETDKKSDSQIVLICYVVSIGDQTPNIENDPETNKYGWFSLDKALGLDLLPMTAEILIEAHKMCKKYVLLDMLE